MLAFAAVGFALFGGGWLADGETIVTGKVFACPDGAVYWLHVAGDGECRVHGQERLDCWSRQGDAEASVRCRGGCEVSRGKAGCQRKRDRLEPSVVRPLLDVECPNGKRYRLTDDQGTCRRDTDAGGETTGGTCRRGASEVEESAHVDCGTGCEFETPGAECRRVA